MVHGLEILKDPKFQAQLNGTNGAKLKVPERCANSPGDIRAWANRPWTKEELNGHAKKPEDSKNGESVPSGAIVLGWAPPGSVFSTRDGQKEGLRT